MPVVTMNRPAGFRLEAAADFYRDFIPGRRIANISTFRRRSPPSWASSP
jgi:hypothetical protein